MILDESAVVVFSVVEGVGEIVASEGMTVHLTQSAGKPAGTCLSCKSYSPPSDTSSLLLSERVLSPPRNASDLVVSEPSRDVEWASLLVDRCRRRLLSASSASRPSFDRVAASTVKSSILLCLDLSSRPRDVVDSSNCTEVSLSDTLDRPVGNDRAVLLLVDTQVVISVVEIEGWGVLIDVRIVVLVAVTCDLVHVSLRYNLYDGMEHTLMGSNW